jgi:hypothetical protein
MNAFLRFRWLLAGLIWVGTLLPVKATHILGGDIAYEPVASTTVGIPRYHITVRLYRDITQIDQTEVQLTCSRDGCSATTPGSFTRTLRRTSSTPVTSLRCSGIGVRSYDYEIDLFETEEDLPPANWMLSVYAENRSADIQNIPISVTRTIYISSSLNNSLAVNNSSPKFLTTILPYLYNNSNQTFTFSTFDIDGDSLVYNQVVPQEATQAFQQCGQDIAGVTAQPFQLDRATGALTASTGTVQQGRYAIAARIDEYRRLSGRWQQIGSVTRDITYIATQGTNDSPTFTGLTVNGSLVSQPVSQQILVQPGQSVRLLLSATDPNAGQTLRFASQAAAIIPGMKLVPAGTNQIELRWDVPNLPSGRYSATVAVLDNACPLNGSQEITLSFLVTNQVLADRPAQNLDLAAYPMPFREQVQFRIAAGTQAVTIIDELGRTVARLTSQPDGQVLWQPAATLPAGLYVARGANGRLLARLLRAAN